MSSVTTDIKPKKHYEILDGLRGVAAILVVAFHVFETFALGNRFEQIINHGYLAVDFFFLLSGFVVAYAYDDRWVKMTQWEFYKRRLIRLQPMVIMGMIIGAALFYFQASDTVFPQIAGTPVWKVILVMLIGFTLIPLPPSADIRGWGEMHSLNGPAWSLFFEYIANILYAVLFRRFSNKVLSIFVLVFAVMVVNYTVFGTKGDVIGGWSLNAEQLNVGFTRLLYPFFAGILLSRLGKLIHIKGAFWACSILITIVLALPRFGDENTLWMNGLYESFCIILIFPLIVAIGAGGEIKNAFSLKICKILGDISYPIYITHYPLIYWFTAWVIDNKITMEDGYLVGIGVVVTSIVIAYLCLKLYDEPVRNWLQNKFQKRVVA
ncbi:acyltransferase family protein [Flavobacterium hercynium]|uniref:Acyltransferase n=1 Tax=Flavobacterium hercynium TaxID=387094 RepID=A0A226HAB3_9FLAO|nr:acyltransferase [Flavobacterium hercynium]OXA91223.1 acyltransferase [Flavobacterium hercynium]SMP12017.1 Peptidoglycan/LPS O-acetylase OafA/YrhL, contains acyltransferase and SGNH-hydrolase domains [Flavobacterium hercynium]